MNLQLRRAGLERISVEEEIEFVRAYLELATADLGATIHLHVSAAEESRRLPIPPNCVSILVEAVLRARPESVAEVSVRIEVAARDARLNVSVRDDLPVGVASRDLGGWKPLLDLSAGLRGRFGPASVPVFRDVEGGVLGRMSIPVERLVGNAPSGGVNA
jgi:LytS/YehU family sensor histidine kinase